MKAHNLLATGSLTVGSGEVISSISSSVATTTLGLGNRVTTLEGKSLVSGSSQIVYSGLTSIPSGIVSSSAQVSYTGLTNIPSGIVSSSTQVTTYGFSTTGSNTFQGSQTINGSLVITGSLTAQQFIVSSSVTYLTESFASGSHKFGDSSDDTHQFTGSLLITGSMNLTGSLTIGNSNISTTQFNVYTSSVSSQNIMTEFYNADYTSGTRNFIRVRNSISTGSTMSSYFGQGQDGKTYVIANDFTKNHIVIDGINAYVGILTSTPSLPLEIAGNVGITTNGGAVIWKNTGSSNKRWDISSSVNDLTINETGIAERARYAASGNIGFGNSNPLTKVQIGTGSSYTGAGPTDALRVSSNTIGTSWISSEYNGVMAYMGNATVLGGNGAKFAGYNYTSGSNIHIEFGQSGMFLTSGSNLLIGTSNDSGQRLVVNGTAKVSGSLSLASTGGLYVNITTTAGSDAAVYMNDGTNIAYAGLNVGSSANKYVIYHGGAVRMAIDTSGKFGIGTSTPNEMLSVVATLSAWSNTFLNTSASSVKTFLSHGDGYGIAVDSATNNSSVYLIKLASGDGTNRGTNVQFQVFANGNTTVGGGLTAASLTESSSLRYKTNIEKLAYGISDIMKLKTVRYNRKDNETKEIGLIAEEVFEILPEVVNLNKDGQPDSVSYGRITAVLIEAIKDLKKEIEELKSNK